ncbi:MAG TPA: hypothetical protein VFG91_12500 [Woeseiaceae bacterium]|nr:hypothetical protein [Woeseiaceae bacterium]
MKLASARRKKSCVVLFVTGVVALGSGVAIAVYSSAVLMPNVSRLIVEIREDIRVADRALAVLDKSDGLLARSIESFDAEADLMAILPETFAHVESVLRSTANTSFFAGEVTKQAGEGVSGLVLPDAETAESARALRETSEQMRQLAGVVGELGGASEPLAADLAGLSRALSGGPSRPKLDTARLTTARRHLQALQGAIADVEVPALAMFAGMAIAGLYIVIGIICLALASGLSARASASL